MSCTTEPGLQVQELVKKWMDRNRELKAVWDVFEVQPGFDVIISIHQPDGVRRLTLKDQQIIPILTGEVEAKILNWLETLAQQPLVNFR